MKWHELSWPELDALDKNTPVVIPLGSCEQHGRHLPVFVDSLQLQGLVDRLEETMGNRILTLPVLWLGSSHHHLDFPGTVSVMPELFGEMVKSIAHSVLSAGFNKLFFLNGHGGNEIPASNALTSMACEDERADGAHMVLSSWWKVGAKALEPGVLGTQTPALTHACEYETSCVLAIRDDLVHLERLLPHDQEVDRLWAKGKYAGKLQGFRRFRRWTSSGSMGQPQHATKEKGEAILSGVSGLIGEFLDDYATWPPMEVLGGKKR